MFMIQGKKFGVVNASCSGYQRVCQARSVAFVELAQVMAGFFSDSVGYGNGRASGKKRLGISGFVSPDAMVYFGFGHRGVKHGMPGFAEAYNLLRNFLVAAENFYDNIGIKDYVAHAVPFLAAVTAPSACLYAKPGYKRRRSLYPCGLSICRTPLLCRIQNPGDDRPDIYGQARPVSGLIWTDAFGNLTRAAFSTAPLKDIFAFVS